MGRPTLARIERPIARVVKVCFVVGAVDLAGAGGNQEARPLRAGQLRGRGHRGGRPEAPLNPLLDLLDALDELVGYLQLLAE